MARSFSNSKIISAFVSDSVSAFLSSVIINNRGLDSVSVFLSRRGYAAASQGAVSSVGKGGVPRSNVMMKKSGEETVKTSWVPDPVTGYYRPEGQASEIDAAELRKMLLKHRSGSN